MALTHTLHSQQAGEAIENTDGFKFLRTLGLNPNPDLELFDFRAIRTIVARCRKEICLKTPFNWHIGTCIYYDVSHAKMCAFTSRYCI